MNLYVYVENNPINLVDSEGKGIFDVLLCTYYAMKLSTYIEDCHNELDELYEKYSLCPSIAEIEFCKKYGGHGWVSFCIAECVYTKCPDKDLAYKWIKSCVKSAWTPPTVPRRR